MGTKPKEKPPEIKNKGYKQQYGVIIICKDEKQQRLVYEKLLKQKYTLRIVVT